MKSDYTGVATEDADALRELSHQINKKIDHNYYKIEDRRVISLRLNKLTIKTLPDSLWKLKELKQLSLLSNEIIDLSDSIQQLTKLESIILNGNPLIQIPCGLAKIPSLKSIHLSLSQLKNINLKKVEKKLILPILKGLHYDLDETCLYLIDDIIENHSDILVILFDEYKQEIESYLSYYDTDIRERRYKPIDLYVKKELGTLGNLIIFNQKVRLMFVNWIREHCTISDGEIMFNVCFHWFTLPPEYEPYKPNIIKELETKYYDLDVEEDFTHYFRIIKELAQNFFHKKSNLVHVEILTRPIDILRQSIHKFSSDLDTELRLFFNVFSGLNLSLHTWKIFPWNIKKIIPDDYYSPDFLLSSLLKHDCPMCGYSFENKRKAAYCEECDQWVCCGYVELEYKKNKYRSLCYKCIEKPLEHVLDTFTDLEDYSDGYYLFKNYHDWIYWDFPFYYVEELLPLYDNSIIHVENSNIIDIESKYDHLKNFLCQYTERREKYRNKLFSWINRNEGSHEILIEGIKKDGSLFKKKFRDSIRKLEISEPLVKINLNSLSKCNQLMKISINTGTLSQINLDFVKGLKKLKKLHLSHNNFNTIDLSPLEHLNSLRDLFLSDNNLTSLNLKPLSKCRFMKSLKLTCNRLEELDLSPLKNMILLKSVLIDNNSLKTLDLKPLSRCDQLKTISIQNNKLRKIDLSPLKDFSRLSNVIMANNKLEILDLTALGECDQLDILSVNNNKLRRIIFPELKSVSLTTLSLSHNELKEFDCSNIAIFQHLRKLDLSHNPLDELDLNPLIRCSALDEVLITGIGKVITPQVFPVIYENDTIGEWFIGLLNEQNIRIHYLDQNKYDFEYPNKPNDSELDIHDVGGRSGLTEADLKFWKASGRHPTNGSVEFYYKETGKYRVAEKGENELWVYRDGEWSY